MAKENNAMTGQASPANRVDLLIKSIKIPTINPQHSLVRAQNLFIRGSKDNTQLEAKLTSTMLRDKYIKELHIISSRK